MKSKEIKKISVIGAGSWGIAISNLLAEKEFPVLLWGRNKELVAQMNRKRTNPRYLSEVKIHPNIMVTSELAEDIKNCSVLVLAVPSKGVREICKKIAPLFEDSKIVISLAKGLEEKTFMTMSDLVSKELSLPEEKIAALSGPNFSIEVARHIPTATVIASTQRETYLELREIFFTEYFRVYSSHDIIGVEIGGALKNITAIAAGISDGLGFGDNTKASLITRGLAEMTRLGVALGAKSQTFSGLSGMGDLVATCFSRHSRNRWLGEEIGRGKNLEETLSKTTMVVEGVTTTRAAYDLSKKLNIEMPITEAVYEVLYNKKSPLEAAIGLMRREAKDEMI